MKNISRRVFIKGLAVAGVAAAASTVLAGCNTNMIPGTNDEGETEVVPTTGNTYTFKDGDNTLTFKAPSFMVDTIGASTAGKEVVYLAMNVDNQLGETVAFATATTALTATTTKKYVVLFSAKVSDKDGDDSTAVTLDDTTEGKNFTNVLEEGSLDDGNRIDNGYLNAGNQNDTWTKATVTVKVFKPYADDAGTNYYFRKATDPDDTYTFTYVNK